MDAFARFTPHENDRGFRSGHRFRAGAELARPLPGRFSGGVGISWQREEAERWNGALEEEGNLGRTDVLLDLTLVRPVPRMGAFVATLSLPLVSNLDVGGQAKQPPVFALGWMR